MRTVGGGDCRCCSPPPLPQDDPEDLNFRKGDVMTVLRKDEDDWWYARHSDGRVGSIPVPYVEVVSEGGGAGVRLRPQWDPNVCVCLSEHVCVCLWWE